MTTKIDVLPIITRHFDTLRNNATGARSLADIVVFFGFPLIASLAAFYYRLTLTADALTAVLASFSIFAGLLLNLMLLVYTFAGEPGRTDLFAANIKQFIRELHDNIEFAVLVSVFIVILSLIAVATLKKEDANTAAHTGRVTTAILVYLTANFILTLLMVLKRIHMMLLEKLSRPSASSMRKAS